MSRFDQAKMLMKIKKVQKELQGGYHLLKKVMAPLG